jgi:hypothetical protein
MRAFHIVLVASLLSAAAQAAGYDANPTFAGGVEVPAFEARAESVSIEANQGLGGGFKYSAAANGIVVQRYVFDAQRKLYTGYDVLIEPNADAYGLTFRPLSITIDDFAERLANLALLPGNDPRQWKFQAPERYPDPRQAAALETIAVDLIPAGLQADQRVVDSITIMRGPKLVQRWAELQVKVQSPQSTGEARIFDAAKDVQMRLLEPRALINGNLAWQHRPVTWYVSSGELVWFYLPGRGRYILSRFPRPDLGLDLGFVKAGEVVGDSVSFTSEGDVITLQNSMPLAPDYAPHSLYVLREPDYSPASADQKDKFEYGSLSPDEVKGLGATAK